MPEDPRRRPHVIDRRTLLKTAGATGLAGASLATGHTAAAPLSGTSRGVVRTQEDGDTLVVVVDGSPSDLDPHSSYDYRSVMAILGAYEGLIGLVGSSADEVQGLIAESWESNDDLSVWTFKIRPGITFHDGSPVDAEAVRLSYERLLTMGLGPVGVVARFVPDFTQISAPDESTLVFDLGRPQPLFLSAMASSYGPLVVNARLLRDEHEEDGDWGHFWAQTNEEGAGSGPYRIISHEPNAELVMEAYEGYWRGWEGRHFTRVIIRTVTENETRRQLIEAGEADIVDSLTVEAITALESNPDLTVMTEYVTRSDYFAMAVAGPLASPEARKAMCYAFPYNEVIEGVFAGRARQTVGGVPQVIHGFNPETFQYTTDLDQARELLAAAGVEEGTTLQLVLEPGDEPTIVAAQLFQVNLAELGINLDIQQLDTGAMVGLVYGETPVEERPNFMPWFWWPDYNDAWNHLDPQISCGSAGPAGSNMGYYCNDDVEAQMEIAGTAVDDATYLDAIGQVQQIISADDPPAIYWAERPWNVIFRNTVTGIFINPINIGTYSFWDMSVAE
ncbi:MAG: ABC transporter substrate-binding protein [Thermomicrobiales bacterium]|jgi:peptide/nickel transport system substrate-binding protein|nr:ABC transporter substrate-binding protein [Thermomicrobiales bacterium]